MCEYDKYFDNNEILEFELFYQCKKSQLITELRRIGDIKNQYVSNIYYLDTLSFSGYKKEKIYSTTKDDAVYSVYHSECEYCKEHKKNVKKI